MPIKISDLPQWYDRNPKSIIKTSFASGIGPHSATERWNYEVPSGKQAYVEFLEVKVGRVTAATEVGNAYAYVVLYPIIGDSGIFIRAFIFTNNIGDTDQSVCGHSLIMVSGEKIVAYTYDGSTGGTIFVSLQAKITEFDIISPIDQFIVIEDAKPDIQQPSIIDDPPM